MAGTRWHLWAWFAGGFVAALVAIVLLWNWDWFLPLVNRQASAALGRPVTVAHLHIHPGWVTTVELDGITIANPAGFTPPEGGPDRFAELDRLRIAVDVMAYIKQRAIVIPLIDVQRPVVDAVAGPDGKGNWDFPKLTNLADAATKPAPRLTIGELRISYGQAHLAIARLKTDAWLTIATEQPAGGEPRIVAEMHGTYAAQKIIGHLTGGALSSLRDASHPYPVDLKVANGNTNLSLTGTLDQPLTLGGADLKLELHGDDLADLYPLLGVASPPTPPYNVTGQLDYADRELQFGQIAGRMGSTDLSGDLSIDPFGPRPVISGKLRSRRVDLADIGGFIGSTPGRLSTPGETPEQHKRLIQAEARPKLLPTTEIDVPKLRSADFHIHYVGEKILGRSVPFDNLATQFDLVDGAIALHPVTIGIGSGQVVANIGLDSQQDQIHAKADVDFRRVDLSRLMEATHIFKGRGALDGKAEIVTTGNSLSAMLGNGNGFVTVVLQGKGDVSALLVDLIGLQFGDAVLAALGVPSRAELECIIGDFKLNKGVLETRSFLFDTSETRITGGGSVNLRNETLNYVLKGEAKHFTIASLPTSIDITGSLTKPSIRPAPGPLVGRGGGAAGLGVLFAPLALLPTIQFGIGEDNACSRSLHRVPEERRGPRPH